MKKKYAWWERLQKVLPYLVLAAAYLFSIGTFALYGQHNLDSDMSSEMILAALLNKEGRLLTDSWYYSTELRVVSPVPIYQLGLLLFDSWHWARTFALALIQAGVIAAFLFLAGRAGLKRETGLYAASILFLPISQAHTFLFAYGAFYTVYFILGCIVLGLVIDKRCVKEWLRYILLAALGFWGGIGGIRIPMQLGVPLLMTGGILLLEAAKKHDSYRELMKTEQARLMIRICCTLAAMFAGFLVNEKILGQAYNYSRFTGNRVVGFDIQKIIDQINDMFIYFGYREGCKLLSVQGLAAVFAIGIVGMMFASVMILARDKEEKLTVQQRMIPLFAACAVVLGILLNTTLESGISKYVRVHILSYFMTGLLLMAVSIFVLIENSGIRFAGIRTCAMILASLAFLFQAKVYISSEYRSSEANYEDFADYMLENGYTKGFSTFWYGNVLTEATDGQIDMYVLSGWRMDELYRWLQKKSHFEDLPEGKVFVYVDSMEDLIDPSPCTDESKLIYEGMGGRAYLYDSAQEVMDVQHTFRKELIEQLSLEK